MPLSVNQIDSELKSHLGIDDNDINQTDRISLINRSFWEICSKFDFREHEATHNFNTVNNTLSYTVPGDLDAMQLIAIVDNNSSQHRQLIRMTREVYQSEYRSNSEAKSKPTHYYREADKVVLYPTPDAAYAIVMKYLKTLDDLVSGGSVEIPQVWHELILFGSVYRGFLRLNDLERSSYYQNIQANMINSTIPTKSKEEADSRFVGVNVLGVHGHNLSDRGRRSLWKGYR